MKGNVINLNTLHLNSVRLNGIGKVQSVSLKGGSTEDPVFPPVEPPVEPTPTYTLSASVTNGKVSAKRNGSAVNLPYTANEGDVIVVEVTPNDGYAFEGWADGNTDNPRSITMNADVALSAQCVEVVQPPVGNYIQFEDAEVERVLMSVGVSSDGVGITMEDAAKVTSIVTTFKGNTEITSFNELRYFTGVTSLSNGAFKNCSALKTIDLSHITRVGGNTVWNNGPFFGCSSLESVNMPIAVEIANYSFNKCSLLKSAQMPNAKIIGANAFEYTILEGVIDIPNAKTISASAFRGTNITELLAPSAQKFDGAWDTGVCQGCKYLVKVDVGVASSLGERTFEGCKALETFIIRATTPPSLNGNLLSNTNSTFLIYVPDASLEAYKTATNWNQFADRIHPLSEIEGDDSRLDYVHDSMFMWLDGIDKGTVEGEWQDLVGNNNFVNHGAIELANGYQFNGKSFMQLALGSSPMQWSDHTTLEVVVEFAGNNTYDIILVSGYQNGLAFGRTSSQLLVASNNERPAYADPLAGYAAGKAVVAVNKNTALYNGSPLTTQGPNYFGDVDRTMLGLWMKKGSYFKGTIHAIRIHDRILSKEEILYNQRIDNKRFNLGLDI